MAETKPYRITPDDGMAFIADTRQPLACAEALAPVSCPYCQVPGVDEPCALHRNRRDAFDGYAGPALDDQP